MATREENLKKINDELEAMSDEELDNVAGGTYKEYHELDELLPYSDDNFTFGNTIVKSPEYIHDWLKSNLNIDAEINIGFSMDDYGNIYDNIANVYTRNGQNLTHEEVIKECKAFLGKN